MLAREEMKQLGSAALAKQGKLRLPGTLEKNRNEVQQPLVRASRAVVLGNYTADRHVLAEPRPSASVRRADRGRRAVPLHRLRVGPLA